MTELAKGLININTSTQMSLPMIKVGLKILWNKSPFLFTDKPELCEQNHFPYFFGINFWTTLLPNKPFCHWLLNEYPECKRKVIIVQMLLVALILSETHQGAHNRPQIFTLVQLGHLSLHHRTRPCHIDLSVASAVM